MRCNPDAASPAHSNPKPRSPALSLEFRPSPRSLALTNPTSPKPKPRPYPNPKVDEVRHWMTLALGARPGREGACRLLALVGPPGSAKSTMVRLLAQDMGVELAEWQVTPKSTQVFVKKNMKYCVKYGSRVAARGGGG